MKPPQSLAGYIRQHLKELEERLEVGVRQEVIVAELEAHGYKTTLKGFRNFLYRARIRAAQKTVPASAKPPSQKEKKQKEKKIRKISKKKKRQKETGNSTESTHKKSRVRVQRNQFR